jgi:RNA polymerase sigma-70 factor, ECF subfamily
MNAPSESLDELLLRCGRGDHPAFEQLYRLAAPRLFALCRRMLRNEELAEESLQESFVQIWRDAARFDPHRALATTWMGVIVRHRCLDLLRRKRPEVSLEDEDTFIEPVDDGAGPLELTLRQADHHALGRCLKTLSEPQRLSITLAFYRGFSHQQLGAYLATPVGTVKSWIRRGLMQLKRCLQQ